MNQTTKAYKTGMKGTFRTFLSVGGIWLGPSFRWGEALLQGIYGSYEKFGSQHRVHQTENWGGGKLTEMMLKWLKCCWETMH